jgi:hypothetical protein
VYKELYKNIDLKVYGVEKQIEYDWLVKPGGDPEAIDFAYQDVLGTEIDEQGDLIIRMELGEFRHRRPVAYQKGSDGRRESVEARFRKIGPDRYGFTVGYYNPKCPLIIDPVVLIYSTFLGGSGYAFEGDSSWGIAVDSSGCAYVTGAHLSSDFTACFRQKWAVIAITKFTAQEHLFTPHTWGEVSAIMDVGFHWIARDAPISREERGVRIFPYGIRFRQIRRVKLMYS